VRVVRGLPVEPGIWLGRRIVRRALVLLIALICLDFALGPQLLSGAGAVLFLLLVLCDVALGRATSRITSAPEEALDERQEALRNRAFRISYATFVLVVGGGVFSAYTFSLDSRAFLASRIGGGAILVFLQLLFFLPAMTVAWLAPDRLRDEPAPPSTHRRRERLAVAMVAAAILVPLALSLAIVVLPVRTVAAIQPSDSGTSASCRYFHAENQVGLVFQADQPLNAVACSDGTRAYEEWGLNESDCLPSAAVLVELVTTGCSRATDPDGTLRFTYSARARSVLLPFLTRDVTLSLALSRDGRVLRFP
jgi:hypothetical protein